MTTLTDEQLMSLVATDDGRAFDVLMRRWQRRVASLIGRILNDYGAAEDLVQEAFLRVYLHRRRFRGDALFRTWLFAIAANLAKNEIRRRTRRSRWLSLDRLQETLGDSFAGLVDRAEGQERALERAQLGREIARAIARVPMTYREPCLLRDVDGLSYAEIGRVLGITDGTVRSRMHRGRELMRWRLRPRLRMAS